MPLPNVFWRRRRGACAGCHCVTLNAVEYRLYDAAVWWCTRCGGYTTLGLYSPPGAASDVRWARRQYGKIPMSTEARRRDWRAFARRMSAVDHGQLESVS